MPARAQGPVVVTVSFIDAINHGDMDRLTALLHDEHELLVFDEAPVVGKEPVQKAWQGYLDTYRRYVICPQRIAEREDWVAVLGYTTGSHLGLPDVQERAITLIWLATVRDERLVGWQLLPDTAANRRSLRLDDA
jgi:hypothetical protein